MYVYIFLQPALHNLCTITKHRPHLTHSYTDKNKIMINYEVKMPLD